MCGESEDVHFFILFMIFILIYLIGDRVYYQSNDVCCGVLELGRVRTEAGE